MTKSRKPAQPQPKPSKLSYRVVRNSCFHAGIEYKIGEVMPDLPIALLNIHLPNLELVEVEDVLVDDETDPETAIAIIDQVEADGGSDYVAV